MKFLYIANQGRIDSTNFYYSAIVAAKLMGWEVHLAYNCMDLTLQGKEKLEKKFGLTFHQIDFRRNPAHYGNLRAYRQLCDLFQKECFDIVHANTPVGGVLGRIVARKFRVKHIIYQAHGFHFYSGAPWINWLLYFPVEKMLARHTDVLITINQEDYKRAQKFKTKEIAYVPGVGVPIRKHASLVGGNAKMRELIGLEENDLVLLSVGELSKRKNHAVVIRAMALLDEKVKYVICGSGKLEVELKKLALVNGVSERVSFLGFRTDVSEICQCTDIFMLPSLQEGLPIALMEAMVAGKPCIASKIRGNTDLIDEAKGGYLIGPKKTKDFANAVRALEHSEEARNGFGAYNREKINEFSTDIVVKRFQEIYESIITA